MKSPRTILSRTKTVLDPTILTVHCVKMQFYSSTKCWGLQYLWILQCNSTIGLIGCSTIINKTIGVFLFSDLLTGHFNTNAACPCYYLSLLIFTPGFSWINLSSSATSSGRIAATNFGAILSKNNTPCTWSSSYFMVFTLWEMRKHIQNTMLAIGQK